jgi:hypothetical protein
MGKLQKHNIFINVPSSQTFRSNLYIILDAELEDKRPFGGSRHWWENNTKMGLKEVYGPVVGSCERDSELVDSIKARNLLTS